MEGDQEFVEIDILAGDDVDPQRFRELGATSGTDNPLLDKLCVSKIIFFET